jgi:ABC-type uncharacterized transport system permease subunit
MSAFLENLPLIFNATLVHSTIRASTPILYAAMSCVLTQQADILNVGVEGIMLSSAFAAVLTSYMTGSWVLGLLAAVAVGLLISAIIGVAHLNFKADVFAVGMAINMLALALTRFGLQKVLHVSGSFYDKAIIPLPRIEIGFAAGNDVLSSLFSGYSLFELLGIPCVFLLGYVLYKTVWGLRLRSVGLNPMAAATAGIDVYRRKFEVILLSGIIGGIAGAHLSLGYSQMFTENMTNGRGFMGVAAMYFGGAAPVLAWVGCLIFGFTDSVASNLQSFGLPSQFMLMIPYVMTVTVLAIAMARSARAIKLRKSSLALPAWTGEEGKR